jgi:hypothetical protein
VEGDAGWDADYLGTEPEFAHKTLGEVLNTVADKLETDNGQIKNPLEADTVFETGFAHLKGSFDAGLPPNKV